MKNIFKKNQIIITALAIMIAIAGYLSFTNNDKPADSNTVQTANPDLEKYDALSGLEETGVVADLTDGAEVADTTDGTDVTAQEDTTVVDEAATDTTEAAATDETVPVDTKDGTDELSDISDEDILASAQDVTDNGEINLQEGVPGEAVLASTTLDAGFFISSKMEREQMRARNKETLMDMIESPDISEAAKENVINSMIALTAIAEKENATELMLEAKGFDGAVVSMNEDRVDVVINAENITDQQLAIIEEVVKGKTDVVAENIVITPVVIAE